MSAIRIVCTFDAEKTAETLARVLAAETHDVRVSMGRASLHELPEARSAQEAVILIWTLDARGAQYMRDWCDAIDPARLIELARAPTWPRSKRRAPAIDFTSWRGERGGKAWGALKDRLRQVLNQWEPQRPPVKRLAAAGLMSACAVSGMLALGAGKQAEAPAAAEPAYDDFALIEIEPITTGGMGGALRIHEPPSVEDMERLPMPARLRTAQYAQLAAYAPPVLPVVDDLPSRTLLERLAALNPLARDED